MPRSICKIEECDWASPNVPRHIAGCYSSWHVYEEHPEVWLKIAGLRPPEDPDPRTSEGMARAMIESALCDMIA